jgi:hypothetical protein
MGQRAQLSEANMEASCMVSRIREEMKNGVFWDVTPCGIPEDTILHSQRRENLKSYKGRDV